MQNTTNSVNDGGLGALLRAGWKWYLAMTLAALALRLIFILRFPALTPDSLVYGDFAKNWLLHHVYGSTADGGMTPTFIRLPGYPAFLAALWSVFGMEHYGAARFAQLFIDIATCFVVADLARRIVLGIPCERVARWAFALAALCPFLANYTAVPLTETPSIFFSALTLDFAVAALHRQDGNGQLAPGLWAGCGLAIAASLYLRPDGGVLLIAVGGYLLYRLARRPDNRRSRRAPPLPGPPQRAEFARCGVTWRAVGWKARTFWAGVVLGACALGPLAPWTFRNWRAFHSFQPLAPAAANAPGEFVANGFERWTRTWLVDYASIEDVGFRLDSGPIFVETLPNRAFDTPEERSRTEALLQQYNEEIQITPELDAQFDQLARERVRRHPFRSYVELPLLRALDLWFRPRTELLPLDSHWWKFREDPHDFAWSLLLALVNLIYVGLAILGLRRWRELAYSGMLVGFTVVRTTIVTVLSYPEPRYVLECYPVVIAFAAASLARQWSGRSVYRSIGNPAGHFDESVS